MRTTQAGSLAQPDSHELMLLPSMRSPAAHSHTKSAKLTGASVARDAARQWGQFDLHSAGRGSNSQPGGATTQASAATPSARQAGSLLKESRGVFTSLQNAPHPSGIARRPWSRRCPASSWRPRLGGAANCPRTFEECLVIGAAACPTASFGTRRRQTSSRSRRLCRRRSLRIGNSPCQGRYLCPSGALLDDERAGASQQVLGESTCHRLHDTLCHLRVVL